MKSKIYKPDRQREIEGTALGLVSTRSFPAIVGTADMMLKSSGVALMGYEKIGDGHCTAIVRGGISDVRLAVRSGVETAEQFGQLVYSSIIPRPLANLEAVLPIGSRLSLLTQQNGNTRHSNLAIGLLETWGFPAMVGAVDLMLKSADVQFTSYELIGAGLCTAIVRGTVANVAVAVEAGMYEAERIGGLNAVMVIPRPLEDLERTLPVASCSLEKPQPLRLPLYVKETEKAAIELPDLSQIPKSEQTLPPGE
jgi:carbon dioxide concentrating mechanism protein CcmO